MAIATGEVITAADILAAIAAVLTKVRKTADETVNNSTILQNDDELLFAVAANEVWEFTIIIFQISSAAADFKANLTGPAGSTIAVQGTGENTAQATFISLSTSESWVGRVTSVIAPIIRGVIINGATAGNLQLQWAQSAAEVSNTKVLANSCIIAHKLA